jgi:hypothetical protein
MHEELRRCNFVGNRNGVHYLAQLVLCCEKTDIESIKSQCAFNNNIRVDVFAAIAFYEYLGLISRVSKVIKPTEAGKRLWNENIEIFGQSLCDLCLAKLFADNLLRIELINYDEVKNEFYIKKAGFPLSSAIFRNFLIEFEVILEKTEGLFYISKDYESMFKNKVSDKRQKLTLEQLQQTLEMQRVQGETAEMYVLSFELERLSEHIQKSQIRKISDIDVSAGYDIVSFNDMESRSLNRFIEVKSYTGNIHFFWSKNELETAKIKEDMYYLYLVDIDKISDVNYAPIIIKNPVKVLIESMEWIMEPQSYKIVKI